MADGLINVSAATLQAAAQEASRPATHTRDAPAASGTSASTSGGGLSMAAALRAVVSGGQASVPPAPAASAADAQPAGAPAPPLVRSNSLAGIDLSSLMGGSNSRFGSSGTPQLLRSAPAGAVPMPGGLDSATRTGVSMTFGFGIGSGASRHGASEPGSEEGAAPRSTATAAAAAAAAGRVKSGNTRAFVFTSAKQRAPAAVQTAGGDKALAAAKSRKKAPSSRAGSQLGSLFGRHG